MTRWGWVAGGGGWVVVSGLFGFRVGARNDRRRGWVGEFAANMFYRVKAYKYYGRGVFNLASLGLEPGMPEEQVLRLLP